MIQIRKLLEQEIVCHANKIFWKYQKCRWILSIMVLGFFYGTKKRGPNKKSTSIKGDKNEDCGDSSNSSIDSSCMEMKLSKLTEISNQVFS